MTQTRTSRRRFFGRDKGDAIQLTPHFSLREWRCKDGTPVPPQLAGNVQELAENLEIVRAALGGRPISIASGYRTPSWNRRSGAPRSQHLYGRAADFRVKGIDPDKVAQICEELMHAGKIKAGGLHCYQRWPRRRGWVHYDTRGWKARW